MKLNKSKKGFKQYIIMIRTIKLFALMLISAVVFCSCKKDEDEAPGYVYLNGNVCYELNWAIEGGGVANPDEGSWYEFILYRDKQAESPNLNLADVYINEFRENGKQYGSSTEKLTEIQVKNLPNIGNVSVNMSQGVYDGKNESVESITINSYGCNNDNLCFDIVIKLKSSDVVRIKYNGQSRHGGFC